MKEIWEDIKGFEGKYQISNYGKVLSTPRATTKGGIRALRNSANGYYNIKLGDKSYYVHRLVAQAFIPNPNNFPEVNHKDETRTNNRVDNLEWCTRKYNAHYGTAQKRQTENRVYMALSIEHKEKISKQLRNKNPVLRLSLNGELVKKYDCVFDAAKDIGKSTSNIHRCANGGSKTAYGHVWKWVEDSGEPFFTCDKGNECKPGYQNGCNDYTPMC